jgi:hypothetical protein
MIQYSNQGRGWGGKAQEEQHKVSVLFLLPVLRPPLPSPPPKPITDSCEVPSTQHDRFQLFLFKVSQFEISCRETSCFFGIREDLFTDGKKGSLILMKESGCELRTLGNTSLAEWTLCFIPFIKANFHSCMKITKCTCSYVCPSLSTPTCFGRLLRSSTECAL